MPGEIPTAPIPVINSMIAETEAILQRNEKELKQIREVLKRGVPEGVDGCYWRLANRTQTELVHTLQMRLKRQQYTLDLAMREAEQNDI